MTNLEKVLAVTSFTEFSEALMEVFHTGQSARWASLIDHLGEDVVQQATVEVVKRELNRQRSVSNAIDAEYTTWVGALTDEAKARFDARVQTLKANYCRDTLHDKLEAVNPVLASLCVRGAVFKRTLAKVIVMTENHHTVLV